MSVTRKTPDANATNRRKPYTPPKLVSYGHVKDVVQGAVGGMVLALVVGEVLQRTGRYDVLWIIAASAYLFALLVIHLLAPRLQPAGVKSDA